MGAALSYRQIGTAEGLKGKRLDLYVAYMKHRWAREQSSVEYATKWAQRFRYRQEFDASDKDGQAILVQLQNRPETSLARAELATLQGQFERISDENNVLWAILKTCCACKHLIPGVIYGCQIQRHIDLSGECNQREEA